MGLVEVLRHLPNCCGIRRDVRRRTMALRPDAFIGIDAPDFNLALERTLKRAGFSHHPLRESVDLGLAREARY